MSKARDYVIRKGGYFYRPEACGYCSDIAAAGRWTYSDAIPYAKGAEGVTVHHLREFPASIPDTDWAQQRDALVNALATIQQRANESGVGEMALIDTIHAMHKIARNALAAVGGSR